MDVTTIDTGSDTATTTTSSAPSTGASTPSSSSTGESGASSNPITARTDRPSFGEALDVFNEQARQQGKRQRGVPSPQGAATTQPDGTQQQQRGPIPFEAHDTALKNARVKERQAVEQQYAQRLQQAAVAQDWFNRAQADQVGFVERNFVDGLRDPWMRQRLLAAAAQALQVYRQQGGGQAESRPSAGGPPPPDFHDGKGNQFYSAQAQAARDQWLINQIKSEVLGQVQPSLDQVEQVQAERQYERTAQQLQHTMGQHLSEARTWPYFKQHEPEIRAALEKAPLTSGHPADEALMLARIYQRIVGPKLAQLEQARVLADLKSKANASSLNPSATGASAGVPKNVRAKDGGNFRAALQWAASQQQGRG